MTHPNHQPDSEYMVGLTCSSEGCKNDAMHDWVVDALCCAHDQILNLELSNQMLREQMADLQRWVT